MCWVGGGEEVHSCSGSNPGTKVILGEVVCLLGGVCGGGSEFGGGLRCQKHLAKFVFYGRPVLCSLCDAFAPLLRKKKPAAVIFIGGVL